MAPAFVKLQDTFYNDGVQECAAVLIGQHAGSPGRNPTHAEARGAFELLAARWFLVAYLEYRLGRAALWG